jgi:putative ABC transport system permease protein
VISYGVAQRKNEIGIRLALGADRRSITAMILREAGVLLAAGLGAGALLSLFIVKAAAALLFGVQPDDPAILATAALSLAVVAVGASYLPARRAGKPDPMLTLKSE